MSLPSSTRLGPYEITARLGAGGMGEVYRAKDSRLKREVALKVLPDTFAQDPERLARFQREAELLATLNHPNIAAIYGFEEANGVRALVLELVEGHTLADRIATGPLPLNEALGIAMQIAEALDAAHERGIVHRDLKPANIKINSTGTVKVLDFGLAKATHTEAAPDLTQSPTRKLEETRDGMLLGTAPYMSPEQARARPVDKRADIWAFGCVLFEMLTGRAAFAGETVSDTIANILGREPSWASLPSDTPPRIRHVLQRCLEKDLKRRARDIADVRVELEEALAAPSSNQTTTPIRDRRPGLMLISAIVAAAVLSGFVVWRLNPAAPIGPREVTRFSVTPIAPMGILRDGGGLVAISPDGRRLAYVASRAGQQQLFVRDLEQLESKPIAGTEGGYAPAFSPDGKSLAFVVDRKLKRVPLDGGGPQTLVEQVRELGISWGADDTIVYSPGSPAGIWRVPGKGGTPSAITTLGKEILHAFPEMLPNGKALLFNAKVTPSIDNQIVVQSLESGERHALGTGWGAHYLPTGHLVYVDGGRLMAVPFDIDRLTVNGVPTAVLDGIALTGATPTPQISFSRTGSMVYVPAAAGFGNSSLVFVDQTGNERPTGISGKPFILPRLAPDGRRLVAAVAGTPTDLWDYDLERGSSGRQTDDGRSSSPVWSQNGRRLTFSSGQSVSNLYWKLLDGDHAELLFENDRAKVPVSWSPDGRTLAFVSVSPQTANDIWLLNLEDKGNSKARPFLETKAREGAPEFSPDGKWLAYVSDESGQAEVYARPVNGPGERWTISAGGGSEPVWTAGDQLFYRNGDAMMVVDVKTTPVFAADKPRLVFEGPYEHHGSFLPNYDVMPDGKTFLMIKGSGQSPTNSLLTVVLNWFEELKQRVPTAQ